MTTQEEKTFEEKATDLKRLLEDAREEVKYYKKIVQETGKKRLREIDQLSKLIADCKRVEEALRESEEKYRTVLEANPDPVIVCDKADRVVYFNPAFTGVFGWTLSECLGKKMERFVPEENRPETVMMLEKLFCGENVSTLESCRYTQGGDIISVSISGSMYQDRDSVPIGYIITLRDIREQKRLEAQLYQAQKIEAIGMLARGIAHDFSNIITSIIGYVGLAISRIAGESEAKKSLLEVVRASEHAKDLVNQILSFSKQSEQKLSPIKIGPIITRVLKLFKASLPDTIIMKQSIEIDSRFVLADHIQIYQILMNLCSNAIHAMQEKGGVLEVTLAEKGAGHYLCLTVSDTGCGMTPEVVKRIFEPHFTTKGKSEGNGLGLTNVQGIVENYGGTISVKSELGEGTTVQVLLPQIEYSNEMLR